jgi:GGDEF domain-containing protein
VEAIASRTAATFFSVGEMETQPLAGGPMVRARFPADGRFAACLLAGWLVAGGAAVALATDGLGRMAAVAVLAAAALAGLLMRDWRETLAISLVGAGVAAWTLAGAIDPIPSVAVPLGVVATGLLAACARPKLESPAAEPAANDPSGTLASAGLRLPPGVADEALLDRLAIHEMTRARRYERPLTLLLIGIEDWSTLVAERGRKAAHEQLSALAVRARRVLRDVDAIGLRGDGRLAVLLPETPLDGGQVVAVRIQQAALEDVRLKTRIGAAVFPDDAVTVEALVAEAEAGLDLARLEGVSLVQRVRIA